MGKPLFDNFRWSSNQDPHWDEWHLTVELPITDPSTGNNVVAPNYPIFEMQPPFTQQTYAAYEDLRITDPDAYVQLPYGIDSMTFKLFFNYTDSGGQPQTWEMPKLIDMTKYTQGYWLLARYTKESCLYPELLPHALHVDYFDYLIGSNLDPILEALFSLNQEPEEFLPIIILMQDKIWYDWPQGVEPPPAGINPVTYPKTDLHRTTDRMLKKLAMKGGDIKDKFLEQEEDASNADNQAEKWDFMIHFAAPVYTGSSATAIYLYEFFARLAISFSQYTFEDYQAYLGSTNPNWPYYWVFPAPGTFLGDKKYYKAAPPITHIHITEGNLTGYDALFGWSYIYQRSFQGQFLDDRTEGYLSPGHEKPLLPGQASIQMFERQKNNEVAYRKGLDEMHGDPSILLGRQDEGYHDYIIITRQYGEYDDQGVPTNMYYERLLVMGLSMEYKINVTDDPTKNYKFRYADIGLFDVDDQDQPLQAFRIPISMQGLKGIPFLKREEVLADSLTHTVFLVLKQKVKWYEKGFFKIFVIIVAIILIIVVAYYGMQNIASSIASAIFGAGASPLLVFVTYVVLSFALGQIISMAGQSIGGIWGVAFTIISGIYLSHSRGLSSGSMLPGSFGNAVGFINSVAPYLQGAQQLYGYYVSTNLQQEWETFMLNAREKQRLLDEAWAELSSHSWLDPWDIIVSRSFQAESPNQFLNRTKNTNPGETANNMTYNFVRMALTLPEYPMESGIVQDMFDGFQQQIGRVQGVA